MSDGRGGIRAEIADGSWLTLESGTLDIGVLTGDEAKGASLAGPDECYRYDLWRRKDDRPLLGWIMLNPSVADALRDDHTIGRCKFYAEREGFGGIAVRNLFAYRTPDPTVLRDALYAGVDVVGPDNVRWIRQLVESAPVERIVVAWGSSGHRWAWPRIGAVETILRDAGVEPFCLGVTAHGQPVHPARLANDAPMLPYAV